MKTKSQMLKTEGRRIAKRPPGNGKGAAPTGRAATDGTAKVQAGRSNRFDVNSKARSNTKGAQPTSTPSMDGRPKQQRPATSGGMGDG